MSLGSLDSNLHRFHAQPKPQRTAAVMSRNTHQAGAGISGSLVAEERTLREAHRRLFSQAQQQRAAPLLPAASPAASHQDAKINRKETEPAGDNSGADGCDQGRRDNR